MTSQVSIETVNVKLNTLLEARREDLEARKEEREQRSKERKEDRAMMHEMASKVGDMATAITIQTNNNEHLNQRVDKVEEAQGTQSKDIQIMKEVQAGNKVRWYTLGAGILGFISVSAIVVTIVLWALDKYLG